MNNIIRKVFSLKKKETNKHVPSFRTVYPRDMPKTENEWYRHIYKEINKTHKI